MSREKVASLLEQQKPQTKDHDPSIADTANPVKAHINVLAALRIDKKLLAKEMVDVVRVLYPRYDKMLHSKCEHGKEYGIQLRADALNALLQKFDPEAAKRKQRKRKRDANRIFARLTEIVARQFRKALDDDGYTVQGWIEKQVYDYLERRSKDV